MLHTFPAIMPVRKTKLRKMLLIMTWGLLLYILHTPLNAAKYSGEIFYVTPGVENMALGNTGITNSASLSCGWYNPALMAKTTQRGLELMHSETFEGLMQTNHFSFIWGEDKIRDGAPHPIQSRIGLVITHIGIDDIALTALENDALPPSDSNRPYVLKRADNNDLTAVFSMGFDYSDKLAWGISPKLAYRSLAENNGYGFGADAGILLSPNEKVNLGMTMKDFFTTTLIWENGTKESVNPALQPEIDYLFEVGKTDMPLHLTAGSEIYTDGRKEAANLPLGPISMDVHLGISLEPVPILKIMGGYDADAFTAGLGISVRGFLLNYAYKAVSSDDLGYSQKISAGYRW